jgi:hypothetical protein
MFANNPAPMREDTTGNAQPLDSAGSTIKSDAIEVVPAPRLELQSGSLQKPELMALARVILLGSAFC